MGDFLAAVWEAVYTVPACSGRRCGRSRSAARSPPAIRCSSPGARPPSAARLGLPAPAGPGDAAGPGLIDTQHVVGSGAGRHRAAARTNALWAVCQPKPYSAATSQTAGWRKRSPLPACLATASCTAIGAEAGRCAGRTSAAGTGVPDTAAAACGTTAPPAALTPASPGPETVAGPSPETTPPRRPDNQTPGHEARSPSGRRRPRHVPRRRQRTHPDRATAA